MLSTPFCCPLRPRLLVPHVVRLTTRKASRPRPGCLCRASMRRAIPGSLGGVAGGHRTLMHGGDWSADGLHCPPRVPPTPIG